MNIFEAASLCETRPFEFALWPDISKMTCRIQGKYSLQRISQSYLFRRNSLKNIVKAKLQCPSKIHSPRSPPTHTVKFWRCSWLWQWQISDQSNINHSINKDLQPECAIGGRWLADKGVKAINIRRKNGYSWLKETSTKSTWRSR